MKYVIHPLAFVLTLAVMIGCSDQLTSTAPSNTDEATRPLASQGEVQKLTPNDDPAGLQTDLAALRKATSKYQNVEQAKADGYRLSSPHFVPNMGFHYANDELLGDGQIEVDQPETLVYDSNDPEQQTRNLVAVEYIILDPDEEMSQEELPVLFSGQTTDNWHYEKALGFWSLHVWVWLDNPEGVFHSTNPRVDLDA